MNFCHVCYCVDEGFERYAIASMISLFLNAKIKPIIHVIHNESTDKKKLRLVEKKFKVKFNYYLVDDKKFYGLPVLGGYSVYYRLLIPEVLPKNISKVLYLDCDTLIEGDLNELFSKDLTDKALAAAEDLTIIKGVMKKIKERLKIPKNKYLFNSGVMVMNLYYFRKNDLINKVLKFMRKNVKKIIMHDQDGLNAVLKNQWVKISNHYNYVLNQDLLFSKKNDHAIVHFAGLKPPLFKILNPENIYCKKYYGYLSMVSLSEEKNEKKILINYIKRIYNMFSRYFN